MGVTITPLQRYWRKHAKPNGDFVRVPPIVCADGFTMSVQASADHYCSPREVLKSGLYGAWEVGYPSKKERALMKYAEDPERPTDTVYGYVPTAVIERVIERHGGFKETV